MHFEELLKVGNKRHRFFGSILDQQNEKINFMKLFKVEKCENGIFIILS